MNPCRNILRMKIWCMIIFVLVIGGCSTPETDPSLTDKRATNIPIDDGGFLSGIPCSAPCFYNITPGVTTEEQALKVLSSKTDMKFCDRWERNANGLDGGIQCSNIGLSLNDAGIVSSLSFTPTSSITVDEVIEKYGPPNVVSVISSIPLHSLKGRIYMAFYYQNILTHMALIDQAMDLTVRGSGFNLTPSTLVERIGYDDKSNYKISRYQTWHGYGIYQESDP